MECDYFTAWRGDSQWAPSRRSSITATTSSSTSISASAASRCATTRRRPPPAGDGGELCGRARLRHPARRQLHQRRVRPVGQGFTDPPVILMPYNYPYVQRLIETRPARQGDGYYSSTSPRRTGRPAQAGADAASRKNNERRGIRAHARRAPHEGPGLFMTSTTRRGRQLGLRPLSDAELDADQRPGQYLELRLAFFAAVPAAGGFPWLSPTSTSRCAPPMPVPASPRRSRWPRWCGTGRYARRSRASVSR